MKLPFRFALVLLILSPLGIAGMAPVRQAVHERKQIEIEQQKLDALTEQNTKLNNELTKLNDPDYLEQLTREQLGLVKPGEISYIVQPPVQPDPPATKPAAHRRKPFYQKAFDAVTSFLSF